MVAPTGTAPAEADLRSAIDRGVEGTGRRFTAPPHVPSSSPSTEAYTLANGVRLLVQARPEIPVVAARAALTIDAAELVFRAVLRELMEERSAASRDTRSGWMSRMSHAIFMVRDAMAELATITGASGSRLESPIQRALRDIQTASNHVFFDRESRYADYGRILTGQGAQSLLA